MIGSRDERDAEGDERSPGGDGGDSAKRLFAFSVVATLGAATLAVATISPLPFLLLLGGEFMVMPFMFERLKRRLEIEKKYAAREAVEMSQDQQLAALPAAARGRLQRLQQLCERIQANYKGLSPASQGVMADQAAKFDAVLASFLRRLCR